MPGERINPTDDAWRRVSKVVRAVEEQFRSRRPDDPEATVYTYHVTIRITDVDEYDGFYKAIIVYRDLQAPSTLWVDGIEVRAYELNDKILEIGLRYKGISVGDRWDNWPCVEIDYCCGDAESGSPGGSGPPSGVRPEDLFQCINGQMFVRKGAMKTIGSRFVFEDDDGNVLYGE